MLGVGCSRLLTTSQSLSAPVRSRRRPDKTALIRYAKRKESSPYTADLDCCHPKGTNSVTRRNILLAGCACPCCTAYLGGRNAWYDSYFAYAMAHSMETYEAAIQPVKQALFGELLDTPGVSKVLEVGIGTAANLQYLKPAAERLDAYVGLDPNSQMQQYAEENAQSFGFGNSFQFVEGSIQDAPFEADMFDAAVMTLVLCSVPDPARSLQEIKRVLKPGGRLFLIEHVAAGPRRPLINIAQKVLDPLQQAVADGCHLTRDTGATIRVAGFKSVELREFEVEGLAFLAPHISGVVQA